MGRWALPEAIPASPQDPSAHADGTDSCGQPEIALLKELSMQLLDHVRHIIVLHNKRQVHR